MKRKIIYLLLMLCIVCKVSTVSAWGTWGHNHINRGAVMALPKEMGMFFYNHIDFITEESTVPDLRKYTINDRAEFSRHFINLELYGYESGARMPRTMKDALARYGKDTLDKNGMLPWYIQDVMIKLTAAFKNKRKTEILFLAADLGHYIGDGHMPLHTTVNRDGQSTGQEGVHALWEAQLPELFGKQYNLYTGEAHFIGNVEKAVWDMISHSYSLADTLLYVEGKMKKDNPEDKQYVMGTDGKPKKNKFGALVHTYSYSHVYHELLNGMVEQQMRAALMLTADLWYTAWVNAGRPDLSGLDPEFIVERNKVPYKEDMKAWKKGKVKGCGVDKEFPAVK